MELKMSPSNKDAEKSTLGAIMTGGEHGKDSKVLYFKKKDKLISTDGYKPRQRKRKVRIRY